MKTIKEILEKAAAKDKVFFTFNDKEELKKMFRLLNSVGFTWGGGAKLFNTLNFDIYEKFKAFTIDKGIYCSSVPAFTSETGPYARNKKTDFFKFLEDNNIKISSKRIDFNIDLIKFSSYIETSKGYRARIICTDLKSGYPIVAAIIDNIGEECVKQFSKNGLASGWNDYTNLYLVIEYLELDKPEEVTMTIQEIKKALGITNLKVVE